MRINNTNQSFSAQIVQNETYRQVVQNAKQANQIGLFGQTINFINAVEAIMATDEFDTFEIQSKEPKKTSGDVSADEYFQIIIDGKPCDLGEIEYPEIALGNYINRAVTKGILAFAKEHLGADIDKYEPTEAYKNYYTLGVQLSQCKQQVECLRDNLKETNIQVSNEFKPKLDALI
ncbi:MAG: hypothetical protein IKU37_05765 [Candidatus Gastranaerophilales bacterium]|nr:hypothetical protein [Candidatus Gastranaerophilales bacterium]